MLWCGPPRWLQTSYYGLTAVSAYALDVYGNSPAYNAAEAEWGNTSMVQFMTVVAPNAAAVAQLKGSNIYINPSWVNGMSPLQQEAMVLHELLHNITGQAERCDSGSTRSIHHRRVAEYRR